MERLFDGLTSARIMLSDSHAKSDSTNLGRTPVAVPLRLLTALLTIVVVCFYADIATVTAIMAKSAWGTLTTNLVSWRALAILLVLLNSKSFPLSWHLRLLYHFVRNIRREKPAFPASATTTPVRSGHPLFQPASIVTRAPLFECDYNGEKYDREPPKGRTLTFVLGHKSNSTFFTDLDASRTKRVTSLVSPAFPTLSRELEKEGFRGRFNVILGSVHTSFRREIKPYERYEVRSKILTWDRKWMVIISHFIVKRKGCEEVCAASISKYVMKKGRYTVSVERLLHQAGLVPVKPAEKGESGPSPGESAVLVSRDGEKEQTPPSTDNETPSSGEGITASSIALTEGLEKVLSQTSPDTDRIEPQTSDGLGWTWEAVEAERVRGMALVETWLKLDVDLLDEFSQVK